VRLRARNCHPTARTPLVFRITLSAYSYIQFSASKAPTNGSSKIAPDASVGGGAGGEELTRARVEIAELRLQLSERTVELSNMELQLANSHSEIARLQSQLQVRGSRV